MAWDGAKDPFDIPIQYVNFVSFLASPDDVVIQLGQQPTRDNGPIIPVAKVIMSRENAIAMLEFLKDLTDKMVQEKPSG